MNVLVRKSVAGAEYWDSEKKKSIFVPKGMQPDFEVTENPKSMITPETQAVPATVIDANEIVGGIIQENKDEYKQSVTGKVQKGIDEAQTTKSDDLETKTVKELRVLAKQEGIDIPNAIRTKGDIINIIESAK
ncbi:Rho termination factor N-terminal domain-containing protein [Enterococcus diestrammenae]|uniref:Rho termination factor N-terminal domain-containing protein n=1 Tax=Enterococcus diestrammenae TaxID=1155073 RepID=A0ABV0EYU6_9ENTE|nr:Rho termination factor N-terminal domain-containing protein [Enterococcus diestrammenae]KAF1294795.1 hypothetical protein BAU18_03580 [Enterococcus diestrammenae]